ncbi:hypothetical protein QTG56_25115 (plasmid) [Rossellomorea sp. AcN35-11]|nr:hypothetical protein [Rossellomorea aquimaris]WJV31915.1 hypothetical protein QTG56_25115 [Rossellomorea sp. AcN35-11]
MKAHKLPYPMLAVIIEYLRDKAGEEGKALFTIDDLLTYFEENPEGSMNYIPKESE